MIKTYRNPELETLLRTGKARRIPADLQRRIQRRLLVLDNVSSLREIDPAFRCHPLKGQGKGTRYALAVNGPWRVTFRWEGTDAYDVDLEQYH